MHSSSTAKSPSESITEQTHVVMPQHLNGSDRLFGGQLALWIDEVAGITAGRHCGTKIITAAIDNLRFLHPVGQNEVITLLGRVTYVGRTSLEVRVDSFSEGMTGHRKLINTAFLVEVSLDENGNPTQVPELLLTNGYEEAQFDAGKRRREFRKKQRSDLYD